MKFIGDPGMLVRIRSGIRKRPILIRFDENGFYETDNKQLIRRLSAKFGTADKDSKKASTGAVPAAEKSLPEFTCSKCGKTCKSAAGLISHERTCKG
jgi:hypothetical protein